MKSIREIAEEISAEFGSEFELDRRELTNAIDKALRDERARCTKIAQSWGHRSDVNPARAIASAIQQGIEP